MFARPARLPAVLALGLVAMAALQLALPSPIDLPPADSVARVGIGPLPADPAPVFIPASLTDGGLFAPVAGAPGAAAATDPLGGVTIAGVVQKGRMRLALVVGPGTTMHYVAAGGQIAGWRLVSLGQSGALLRRAGDHIDLAYGAHPVSAGPAQSADNTQ
jgi:hypothetical protein